MECYEKFLTRFIVNILGTSTRNSCIEKNVSPHQVFSILFYFFCFVIFTTTNQKLKIMLLIYRHKKWPNTVRRCQERVIASKKVDDECDSSLDQTDAIELKDNITIIQKYEVIIKNTKVKYFVL